MTDRAEVRQRGGRLAYDTPLISALRKFIADVNEREQARAANPASLEGLGTASAQGYRADIEKFIRWLEENRLERITTGQLDPGILQRFLRSLAIEAGNGQNTERLRTGATLNKFRRNIKAGLFYLDGLRPSLFPDFAHLKRALKPIPTDIKDPVAFSPKTLTRFLETAIEYDSPDRRVRVVRRKPSGDLEEFWQVVSAKPATSISRLFLLLTLLGCRLSEAIRLLWEDVDLERGRVRILRGKTRRRLVPLTGAPEGEIAPRFLELLRQWRDEDKDGEYVLRYTGGASRTFPTRAWQSVNMLTGDLKVGPQLLRENFCSYGASLGVPATVLALWQGHSPQVAERWYRAQVLERNVAASMEEAMGLTEVFSPPQARLIKLDSCPRKA